MADNMTIETVEDDEGYVRVRVDRPGERAVSCEVEAEWLIQEVAKHANLSVSVSPPAEPGV